MFRNSFAAEPLAQLANVYSRSFLAERQEDLSSAIVSLVRGVGESVACYERSERGGIADEDGGKKWSRCLPVRHQVDTHPQERKRGDKFVSPGMIMPFLPSRRGSFMKVAIYVILCI